MIYDNHHVPKPQIWPRLVKDMKNALSFRSQIKAVYDVKNLFHQIDLLNYQMCK